MMKDFVHSWMFLILVSFALFCGVYIMDSWFLFSTKRLLSPNEILFTEGFVSVMMGVLFLIGSGGLTGASQKAAILAATAKAFDDDAIGPDEVYRRDSWKPRGFTRLALVFLMTGAALILVSFVHR
jgi:hypothetical protein